MKHLFKTLSLDVKNLFALYDFSQSSQPGPNLIFIEFFSRKKDFPDSWANIMTMNASKHIETFLKTCSQNILFDPEYIYPGGLFGMTDIWQTGVKAMLIV